MSGTASAAASAIGMLNRTIKRQRTASPKLIPIELHWQLALTAAAARPPMRSLQH